MNWYLEVLRKYAVFSGRARRREYWMFSLVNIMMGILLSIVDSFLGTLGLLGAIYSIAIFLPSLAVTVRRLHDTNRSGWWVLISLIPLIGWIFFLILMIQDSTYGENNYGQNPKEENFESFETIPLGMKRCPRCTKLVEKEARVCRFCGYEFYPKPKTIEEEINEFEKKEKNIKENELEDDEII